MERTTQYQCIVHSLVFWMYAMYTVLNASFFSVACVQSVHHAVHAHFTPKDRPHPHQVATPTLRSTYNSLVSCSTAWSKGSARELSRAAHNTPSLKHQPAQRFEPKRCWVEKEANRRWWTVWKEIHDEDKGIICLLLDFSCTVATVILTTSEEKRLIMRPNL